MSEEDLGFGFAFHPVGRAPGQTQSHLVLSTLSESLLLWMATRNLSKFTDLINITTIVNYRPRIQTQSRWIPGLHLDSFCV